MRPDVLLTTPNSSITVTQNEHSIVSSTDLVPHKPHKQRHAFGLRTWQTQLVDQYHSLVTFPITLSLGDPKYHVLGSSDIICKLGPLYWVNKLTWRLI